MSADRHPYRPDKTSRTDSLKEPETEYEQRGFNTETEDERMLREADRPGIDKLRTFTRMIRRNRMLHRAEGNT